MLFGIFVVFIRKYECEHLELFFRLTSGICLFITEIVISISIGLYVHYGDIIIESNLHAGEIGNSDKTSFTYNNMRKNLTSRQYDFFRVNASVEPYFRHDNFDIVLTGILNADFRTIYILFVTTEKHREEAKQ